jgi:hypothetical protein
MTFILFSNNEEINKFYENLGLLKDISAAMIKYNDFNENNYLIKYIDIKNLKLFDFDYSKNLIIYIKGKFSLNWCIKNLKNYFTYYLINDDTDIYSYSNIKECQEFYKKYKILNDISFAMKYFNDFNKNNYTITYLNNEFDKKYEFDEELYDIIHIQYLEFLNKNPNTKLIIYTNGLYGFYWCKNYLKFINSFIYYKANIEKDLEYIFHYSSLK